MMETFAHHKDCFMYAGQSIQQNEIKNTANFFLEFRFSDEELAGRKGIWKSC